MRYEKWQGIKATHGQRRRPKFKWKCVFSWLWEWSECPSYIVTGMYELYEQLLLTKLYTSKKKNTTPSVDVMCWLCGKCPGSKYLERLNSALKVLFFELLRDLKLIDSVPPWYFPVQPKSTLRERGCAGLLGYFRVCGI